MKKHEWVNTDSQGYSLECADCGLATTIYASTNWDKDIDSPCLAVGFSNPETRFEYVVKALQNKGISPSIDTRQRTPSESLIQWEVNVGATFRSLFFYLDTKHMFSVK